LYLLLCTISNIVIAAVDGIDAVAVNVVDIVVGCRATIAAGGGSLSPSRALHSSVKVVLGQMEASMKFVFHVVLRLP
jgi:hypothetical protein